MKAKRMKKYTVVYEVDIEAKNIEQAEEMADLWETKDKARLKRIEGKNESWETFYESKQSCQNSSSFKNKRK
jgi:hypothetical protein